MGSREYKLSWLRGMMKAHFKLKPNTPISRAKLCGQFALAHNSTIRTGNELISLLVIAGEIKVVGDVISKS